MGADGLNWRDHLKARDFFYYTGILVIFSINLSMRSFSGPLGRK